MQYSYVSFMIYVIIVVHYCLPLDRPNVATRTEILIHFKTTTPVVYLHVNWNIFTSVFTHLWLTNRIYTLTFVQFNSSYLFYVL